MKSSYGPTFLYYYLPPFKKLVYSRAEELEHVQLGWRDFPFSEEEKEAAAAFAKEPEPSLGSQMNPPTEEIKLEPEQLPYAGASEALLTPESVSTPVPGPASGTGPCPTGHDGPVGEPGVAFHKDAFKTDLPPRKSGNSKLVIRNGRIQSEKKAEDLI